MLISLSIRNYALIENLRVDFKEKFSIITGETGAGKSILLGGLALVLGKRADTSLVYDKEKKCIIEAEFDITNYELKNFLADNDLDFELLTIIRREVLPNGKSRAFINDTPVNLSVLNKLTEQLIDIHSQHETLELADLSFQFHIIDALGKNKKVLGQYSLKFARLKTLQKDLDSIVEQRNKAQKEYDYNVFVLNELEEANLIPDEQDELEQDLEKLSHVEEIKAAINSAVEIAENDQIGARSQLLQINQNLSKISSYSVAYDKLSDRLESLLIEFKDLMGELESENENLSYNPVELERVEHRLQLIYDLQKKHAVVSVNNLLEIRDAFQLKIIEVDRSEELIAKKQLEIEKTTIRLDEIAVEIHQRRMIAIPEFIEQIELVLRTLEMKNTRFKINIVKSNSFLTNGRDHMEFLMSSDKGQRFENIKKVASGGEMSRIMLGVKSILSRYSKLPVIIFDEIDTGVSGEVSNRVAEVMLGMSNNMQVIAISHLPQVAAKGNQHYKVYKEEKEGVISSNIKMLNENERLVELAEMLGGHRITDSAMAHAKQLLS